MGRKNDTPRVVGFDFGPPAGAPVPETPAAPGYPPAPPAGYAPPAEPAPPAPSYPPPGYAPPAPPSGYAPPAPPSGYAPPVSAAYTPPPAYTPEEYAAQYAAPAPQYAAPPAYTPPAYTPPGYDAPAADSYWGGPAAPDPQPWGTPGYGTDLRPAPPAKNRVIPIGAIAKFGVLLLFVGGGVKAGMRALKPPVSLPASIGGQPRDDSPQGKAAAKSISDGIENVHAKNSAVYGAPGAFTYLLVAGDSDDGSGRDIYETYAKDVRQEGGRTSPPETYGDVTCTTTTDSGVSFSLCFWGGSKSDGIVVQFEPGSLEDLAAVTAEARSAVD